MVLTRSRSSKPEDASPAPAAKTKSRTDGAAAPTTRRFHTIKVTAEEMQRLRAEWARPATGPQRIWRWAAGALAHRQLPA